MVIHTLGTTVAPSLKCSSLVQNPLRPLSLVPESSSTDIGERRVIFKLNGGSSVVMGARPRLRPLCVVPRVPCRGSGERKMRDEDIGVSGPRRRVFGEKQTGAHGELHAGSGIVTPDGSSGDKRIFVFGFGYTSRVLASYLKRNNWKVSGTHRSEEQRMALEQCGFATFLFNSDNDGEELRDGGLWELQQASHWLTSIPPVADFDRDPVLATHARDLIHAAEKGNVGWIGYLSSTGVYGDWQGDWVDEGSEPRPVEPRAVARLAAEKAWLKFGLDHDVPVHVFRLGGIYGPGRSVLDTISGARSLSARQQERVRRRFTSRIHVEDICQVLLASMGNPDPGRTYNVVDDDPAPRNELVAYARGLLESKKVIRQSQSAEDPTFRKKTFDGENLPGRMGEKRVSNKRIKQDLRVQLLHPTYRSGIRAILEAAEEARS